MDSDDIKSMTTIRLEPRLKRAAKHHSLSYPDCRLINAGSWAWYMRQALLEKLARDGFDPRSVSIECAETYAVSRRS